MSDRDNHAYNERAAVEERSELERVATKAIVHEWWHGYYRGAA
jgi:hypothetical protein